jgi:hypothetical protein
MNLTLEKWWHGYVVSPLGAVAGVMLLAITMAVGGPMPSRGLGDILSAIPIAAMGVLISYFVGLMLLPVFVVLEACDWRGGRVYVTTGLAAGLLTGLLMGGPAQAYHVPNFALCGLCGALCAVVFAIRVADLDRGPTALRNIKRQLVISIAVIGILFGWLFRHMFYAAFMGWWTGKGSAHYWP